MSIRENLERMEEISLSPFATLSVNSRGRDREEPQCDIRPVFQRDRDRILHCKSFRRLKHKTQVFLSPKGDHYRTRLTHTLEVSQNARTIAKALRLNEDLVEAIALGHDLGHTPFGHAGERILNELCDEGYRHNEQSVRIVEKLEKDGKGLNLTWEVRDGILNHQTSMMPHTLEGKIVRLSDKIAYINHDIDDAIRGKIASFCDVDTDCVFTNEDCASIYDVPQLLAEQDFDLRICERLGLDPRERDMSQWNEFLRKQNHANQHADKVKIAVVGKYTQLPDAYLSVIEALHHAGVFYDRHVDVQLVDGESLDEQNVSEVLGDASGILVPGGFGKRALEGKILAAEFAREHKIPYLGICLGMQVAVCEFARNVVGLAGASSSEFDPDGPYSVIDLMDSQEDVTEKGGTMRLGAYPCRLAEGSLAREAYDEELVYERHRHRYEFNNAYRDELERAGLVISGVSPDGSLVEMVELPRDEHPWFVATQAHPEFKSRPTKPQPLFREFVRASIARHEGTARTDVNPINPAER